MKARIALATMLLAFLGVGLEAQTVTPKPTSSTAWGDRLDVSGGYALAPSYGAEESALLADAWHLGAAYELTYGAFIPFRFDLRYVQVSASTWDASYFRYRAFFGLRMAAEAGLRLDLGNSGEFDFLGGLAVTPSGYTDLSVATAYLSVLAEARWILGFPVPFTGGGHLVAALPVEYLFRGTARTVEAGLSLGMSWTLRSPAGGAK